VKRHEEDFVESALVVSVGARIDKNSGFWHWVAHG